MSRGQRTWNITVPLIVVSGFLTFLVAAWVGFGNPQRAALIVVLTELALVSVAVIGVLVAERLAEWFGTDWSNDRTALVLRDAPGQRSRITASRLTEPDPDPKPTETLDRQIQMYLRRTCWELAPPAAPAPEPTRYREEPATERRPAPVSNERRTPTTRTPPSRNRR